jgi:hypothetical protein
MADVITTELRYITCGGDPLRPLSAYVEDPLSAITSGTTYYRGGVCYEIINIIKYGTGVLPTTSFSGGPYNDCRECYGSNYDYVAAVDCINESTYYFEFSGFTGGTPLVGEVYFIETIDRGVIQYNCFEIKSYGNYDPENPVDYTNIISTTLSTDCTDCLNSSFLIYDVTPCLGSSTEYVGLSSTSYSGHLISFVDSLGDQRCGTVGLAPVIAPQTVTFISDYGLYNENCDECNSQVAEQRILTNCLTGDEVIVWNSLFFNGGETSNLSSSDGCFSVGNIVTGQTVDINEFLNFDPQPSCAECIECNGIQYNYTTCNGTGPISGISYSYTGTSFLTDGYYTLTGETNEGGLYGQINVIVESNAITDVTLSNQGISYSISDTITILGSDIPGGLSPDDDIIVTISGVSDSGSILSYQYLESPVGTIFYYPPFNECCEITGFEPPTNYTWAVSSLETFDTCSDCLSPTYHYVWYGTYCDGILGGIAVTTTVGFGVGDFVKIKNGNSDYLCVELIDVYDYGLYGPLNSYNSLTTESYSNCDECNGTVRIGVSVLSCETNEASYVNIPLNAWYAVAGYSEVFEGLIISDYQGNCYRVINTCPIGVNGNNLDVQHIFTSCSVCYDFYHPIIHVNQYYETIIVGYVPGSGDTVGEIVEFNTPHPIWTDGNDTRRTLIQKNAITLGGLNGLNN